MSINITKPKISDLLILPNFGSAISKTKNIDNSE